MWIPNVNRGRPRMDYVTEKTMMDVLEFAVLPITQSHFLGAYDASSM